MKKIILLLPLLLLISCGVSKSDKEYLNIVFSNKMFDLYSSEKFHTMFLKTELSKVRIEDDNYFATFRCTFDDIDDNKVSLWGDVTFDESKNIKKLPEDIGKNKLCINVSMITVNGHSVPSHEKDTSKYVLETFSNRNKYNNPGQQ